jgi:rare lipoprotein A
VTKRRPAWSERWQWAAALLCGLLLLNWPAFAGPVAHKADAVNTLKQAKKPTHKPSTAAQRHAKKNPKLLRQKKAGKALHEQAAASIGLAEMRESEETGLHGAASFYGQNFHGRRVATGERFDVRAFTGASNHFPLGSWVAVRRLDSARCAIVRINDRMHAKHQRRIIDVSRAVATYLDMIRSGVVLVRVAPLKRADHEAGACQAAFETDADCPDCSTATLPLPHWPAEAVFPSLR